MLMVLVKWGESEQMGWRRGMA